jgi:hypothetical protein
VIANKEILLVEQVTKLRLNNEGESENCMLFTWKKDTVGNLLGFPDRNDQSQITNDQSLEKLHAPIMHGRGLFKFSDPVATATD